ncbi:type II secretion system F family protein [Intestinibaculum porci]|uniref:MSHA biogenesis protein MshG n=1 Tax=Intestinibaculum porci TaxID=2487118 RepID=A0A3G9JN93_9FIRM|nr:type II secretion system F family protein [Intestinibaculum porci]MDD6349472.1 type II secretion system F family protein [Intestinibaculum porci]MDD6422795.1 type II secretion system F family protein [Intestinibaculum porci]BBH25688.1 MSHA biogenesis protein MshG [Intestinibaculum porci]HAN59152.1 type II secretion system F family protein [Erysipelotrichaceae bacterium]
MDKQLNNDQIASFTHQMALILHAGISPYEGMAIMKDEETTDLSTLYASIDASLDAGESLTAALKQTSAFPDYVISMVNIGETAGRLEEVMNGLSDYYERLYDMEQNINTAVSYPLIMIIMMFAVIIVLITQVLPIFNRVFESLGSNVSGFALYLLNLGKGLTTYSWIFVGLLVIILVLFFYVRFSKKGRQSFIDFLATSHFSRNLSLKMALSKFSSGMSIALSSGLDMEEALDLSKQLIDHKVLRARLEEAEKIMKEKDISTGLTQAHVLTGMYGRLIKLGYQTGGMDTIFRDIANAYDQETSEALSHAISIIEPTLVIILSIITGIILLSVMLPLLGIMGSL